MKTDPNMRGFYSFAKTNLLLHFLIDNSAIFRALKWMSQTTAVEEEDTSCTSINQVPCYWLVGYSSATLTPRITGAQETWHRWAHRLPCLFLNISRAWRLPLPLVIDPLWCSATGTYLSTKLLDFCPPFLEDCDTILFYFPRWANLVMQHFFFSSVFPRLVFINRRGKLS